MSKILIVDDEPQLIEIYQMILEAEFDIDFTTAENGKEAIDKLQKEKGIIGIISDYTMPKGNGGKIFRHNAENANLPFILMSGLSMEDLECMDDFYDKNNLNLIIPKPIDDVKLIGQVRKILEGESLPLDAAGSEKFKKVRLEFLLKHPLENSEVFMKLSDEKFIKVTDSEFNVDQEQIKSYVKKGASHAYLLEADYNRFLEANRKRLLSEVDNFDISNLKNLGFAEDVLLYLGETLELLKFEHGQKELIERSIENCLKTEIKNVKIQEFVENLKHEKGYLVFHSLLIIYLSHFMIDELETTNERSILEKIAYAGIFHDLSLSSSTLSSVIDIESDEYRQLTLEERQMVKSHPQTVGAIIDSIEEVPTEVATIIKEHHELPDGEGYPRGINGAYISHLSCIFIICLRVSDYIYRNSLDTDAIRKYIKTNFSSGNFKRPAQALIKYFDKI